MFAAMYERGELRIVTFVTDERECFEYGREPRASVACVVPQFCKMREVVSDLAVVPGDQDRFDSTQGQPASRPGLERCPGTTLGEAVRTRRDLAHRGGRRDPPARRWPGTSRTGGICSAGPWIGTS